MPAGPQARSEQVRARQTLMRVIAELRHVHQLSVHELLADVIAGLRGHASPDDAEIAADLAEHVDVARLTRPTPTTASPTREDRHA